MRSAALLVSGGLLRKHGRFMFDPLRKAGPREDALDVGDGARISRRIDPGVRMPKIREWSRNGDVSEGKPGTHEISAFLRYGSLEIVEDRRKVVQLGLRRRILVARNTHEPRRDDPIEEDLRSAGNQD